jgi:Fic family protein
MRRISAYLRHFMQRVHFEGPPGKRLEDEMGRFLEWFNGPPEVEGLLRVAIAHLWFVTIHPFEDGNGRIARAIADLALAQTEGSGQRFYSISSQSQRLLPIWQMPAAARDPRRSRDSLN